MSINAITDLAIETPTKTGDDTNLDFNLSDPSTVLNYTPTATGTWDNALWDAGVWGGGLTVLQQWQGLNGVGYYGAPIVKTSSQGVDTRWVSTDIVIEKGAVL